jgi:hypothetical protein
VLSWRWQQGYLADRDQRLQVAARQELLRADVARGLGGLLFANQLLLRAHAEGFSDSAYGDILDTYNDLVVQWGREQVPVQSRVRELYAGASVTSQWETTIATLDTLRIYSDSLDGYSPRSQSPEHARLRATIRLIQQRCDEAVDRLLALLGREP